MRDLVAKIVSGDGLDETEAARLLQGLTSTDLDPATAAAALAGMATRGETATELRVFARGLQEVAVRPDIADTTGAVDVVGTGGDASHSLNLSTGAALVAAAAGARVIKHGNRSVSSASGSFDVLAALGLNVPWGPELAGRLYEATGFTYLFAPAYHPAMRTVAPVRQAIGARTIFNLVGPLANPARPRHLVVGAFSAGAAEMLADTLAGMDVERAFVVHGEPGWDEPTPAGPYLLFDVTPGSVRRLVEDPVDLGLRACEPTELVGGDPGHNAEALRRVLGGESGAHRDAVLLGAALALRVTGHQMGDGLEMAADAVDSGRAGALVERLSALSSRETADV
jgi:anthranilate phosphoribosyltransferase